jgi:hypothetical protein
VMAPMTMVMVATIALGVWVALMVNLPWPA